MAYIPTIPGLDRTGGTAGHVGVTGPTGPTGITGSTGATGANANLAAPGPIGAGTPAAGNFTTLVAGTSLQVGGGVAVTKILAASAVNPSISINALSYSSVNITVVGAAIGDAALIGASTEMLVGGLVMADILVYSNTVEVVYFNTDTNVTHALGPGTITVVVIKIT